MIDRKPLASLGVRFDHRVNRFLIEPFLFLLPFGSAGCAFDRVLGAVDRVAGRNFFQSCFDVPSVFFRELEPHPLSAELFSNAQRRSASAERIQHKVLRMTRRPNDSGQ